MSPQRTGAEQNSVAGRELRNMASGRNVATIPAMGGEAGLNRYLSEISSAVGRPYPR